MNNSRREFLRGAGLLSLLGVGTSAHALQSGWGHTERFPNNTFVLTGNNGGRYQVYEARESGNDTYELVWKKR